VDHEFQDKHLK